MKPIAGGKDKVTHPNAKVGDKGKVLGGGSPKVMDRSMDLGKDATNSTKIDCCAEESPRAKALSTGQA